jgi:hypothetical protein
MYDNVDGQHSKHLPIPDMIVAVLPYRIEHHEAADKETDDYGELGIAELAAVI